MGKIEIINLFKQVGDEIIIRNMNLSLESGEFIGIKCSRATSKVLFDLVEGITISSNGTVSFEKIGIIVSLKADDGLYEKMTTKEYLSFFKKISGTNADIGDFCKDLFLVDILNIKLKMLTLAQIKRVLLARALLFNPSLILFEEPTSELDNEGIKLLIACFQYVCEKGVSIITTSPL